jgi:hypothetical protein
MYGIGNAERAGETRTAGDSQRQRLSAILSQPIPRLS